MAEKEIKRMNFFDGQFLKEEEFVDEQYYHLHMRRRMNFILFESSGVISVNPDDLKFINIDNANKTFQVKAGMAISRKNDDMECKEIILSNDPSVKDLNSEGISAGQTAYVTIHYAETKVNVPRSEGDMDMETRVIEEPDIIVHSNPPPYGPAPKGEEYIYLGALNYDDMTNPDYNNRDEAKIRASLLGAAPVTLVSIAITPASPTIQVGRTVQLTATGTRSDNSTIDLTNAATWSSDNETVAIVDASGVVKGEAAGNAIITAAVGTIDDTVDVNVTAVIVPIIQSTNVTSQGSGYDVTIFGYDIRNPAIPNGQPAAGTGVTDPTSIRLFNATASLPAMNITALSNSSPVAGDPRPRQRVRFTMPTRDASWGPTESVTLELGFRGETTAIPFEYAD